LHLFYYKTIHVVSYLFTGKERENPLPHRAAWVVYWGVDYGISKTQVSYFMTIRKHQIGIKLRPILILFTIMVLLQSIQNARLTASLIQSALPMHRYHAISPFNQQANPLCPVKHCHTGALPTNCPCGLRTSCLYNDTAAANGVDTACQGLPEGQQDLYRCIKIDTLKKRLKRMARRWLRIRL